jgi:hypothetical protein
MFELLLTEPPSHLSGHPDLAVSGNYTRVLWIGTEEETGILRSKADMVVRGLGTTDGPASVAGTFLHRWAPEPGQRLTLDDLPDLLESDGPLDAVVLDSLTGLRPKVRDGRRVAWDLDNDMTNELCLQLRGLAKQHDVDLFLVHHTGRDTGKGYRGPTEWWASADVQVGLIPDGPDRVRVKPEKNRDGRLLKPFYLSREWGPDGFRVSYEGAATQSATLSPSAAKADAFLRGKGRASQRQIAEGAGLSVKTVQRAARDCVEAGLWTDTGETDLRSVVYQHKGGSVDDAA